MSLFLVRMALQEFPWSLLFLAIASLAALSTAILNYLSRPILVRTIERHSDDLRDITRRWLNEIPQPPEADRVLPGGIRLKAPKCEPLRLRVEDEFLFSDLKEHMPAGMNLLRTWKDFKEAYDHYNSDRFSLFNEITKDAETNTGLRYEERFSHGISEYLPHGIYTDIFRVLDGWEPYHLGVKPEVRDESEGMSALWYSGYGFARGTKEEISRAESFVRDTIQKLKDSPYLAKAKHILEERDKLTRSREDLVREIRDFISIPIVPGRCKYIRWSVPWYR